MHSKTAFAAIAALAALVPSAFAGSAHVKNQCDHDVYAQSIADSADADLVTISPGGSYSEEFQVNANGGGISIKLSDSEDQKDVSQFEYTLSDSDNKVFYDLSNIDGYPFKDGGVSIIPSDDSCPKILCEGGVAKCKEAYNKPDDDHATKGCSSDTDLELVLCAGNDASKMVKSKNKPRHPHAARRL